MSLKTFVLRPLALMLTLVMFIGVGICSHEPYGVKDPENCKLNFTVLSDAHIEGNNIPRYNAYARSLQDVKKNISGNDAVVFLGDSTMNGQIIENLLFHCAASMYLQGETVLPVMGNHDIGNGNGDYETLQNRWYDYTEAFFGRKLEHPYYSEVIDGYYFIVLGMESQEVHEIYMSDEQFTWLEGELAKAAESGKPVFVFSHYPSDYVVDADGNDTDRLTELFAEYNREHDLFSFVGHTHMPMHLFWSFHTEDGFPETYLPRLTELAGENDNEYYDETGTGAEIEVYENQVVIRVRDFFRGEWKVDTWEDDEPVMEIVYELKNPIG
ncbi:MAG: metallophosphoesterase [Clostridia bacterium]|nr:metallophosphoesterase [Clostridia bacterium]